MLITESQLRETCTIIKEIKKEKFFVREEDNYFTLYERDKGIVLEISLLDVLMSPNELWGMIKRATRGYNVFVEEEQFEKVLEREVIFKKSTEKNTGETKIININEKKEAFQIPNSIAQER